MSLQTQPYKGARDFYPDDKRIQKYIFSVMRSTVERYGYEEYDAPILEPMELYLAKSSEEIVSEQTYGFKDRGGRDVVIRPEMTPTVSRMVAARRQELTYPLRWYSIPNLWRYERPQKGRLREHWQLNVDIFGVDNIFAEHEVIQLADQIMRNYGATHKMYTIRLNSRKLVDYLLGEFLGLTELQRQTLVRLIDRMHKMENAEFVAQADAILTPTQRDNGVGERLLDILKVSKLEDLPTEVRSHPSVLNFMRLLDMLAESQISNAVFDISVMRGFDYYTDIVFEVFDTDPENNRSMFGGGRYDGLVGLFGVEPIATVGFGMGDVTIKNFLDSHDLLPKLLPETDAYIILIDQGIYEKAQRQLASLREMGLSIAVDLTGRSIDKQIKTAVKKGIPYAVFIGEAELASEQYKLRNLADGSEEAHSASRLVSIVKDHRHQSELKVSISNEDF